jgi:two-component system, OmpR family, catabolic regulation response regulator CreB
MQVNKRRILYAEDNLDIRIPVCLLLRLSDIEVITTDNMAQALRLAEHEHFDLYLLDTRLPDGLGTDLCQRIRVFDRETPILFFSAAGREADKQSAMRVGAQGYLTKPDGLDKLPETILNLINRPRGHVEH